MRKYKATVIVIIMVMLIPFMQSCLDDYDDDIYDMQAGMPFNAALATVVTPSEIPGEAMIESDNDGVAYVVNPDKLTRFETNNPGQRIFYTYINAQRPVTKELPVLSAEAAFRRPIFVWKHTEQLTNLIPIWDG